jgi:hypothetical protein
LASLGLANSKPKTLIQKILLSRKVKKKTSLSKRINPGALNEDESSVNSTVFCRSYDDFRFQIDLEMPFAKGISWK